MRLPFGRFAPFYLSSCNFNRIVILFWEDERQEQEKTFTQRVDERCCGVVRSNSAGTERLSTGLKQLTEDGEAGVRRQRALRP